MANTLVAFALVAEEYEKSGDPVKGLAPLFGPILRERAGEEFDAGWFAQRFTDSYGLSMTPYVAKAISDDLAAIGLLKPRIGYRDQFMISDLGDADESPHGVDESEILEIIGYFERWGVRELERLGIESEAVDFEEALLSRLAHPEFASVFLEKGQPRDSARIKRLLGRGAFEAERSIEQLLDFLVARFLLAASDTAPEVFDRLAAIAFGALIADAVAGIATPGVMAMPDPPLRVVIDGPLLLDALDLNTPAHFEYATALLGMMRKAQLRLATFDHIIDEVRESIQSTLRAHSAGVAYGPLGDRLRSKPGFSTRVSSVLDTLVERLTDFGIDVLRADIYERADFRKYFDDHAVDRVRNAIGDVHHQVERRIRDTKSVAAVVRLKRENRRPSSVFEAGTIFLTRNSALAKQVNRVLAVGRGEPDPRFTAVMDGQLASTLWFSMGAASDFASFSKKRLIANCSSAIVPQKDVIQRIASMLESVDDDLKAEFEVLMRDKRASLCAMRMSGGYVEVITPEFSQEVLEEMRRELAAPLVEPLVQELSAERFSLAQLQSEVNASKEVNATLQEVVGITEDRLDFELAQVSVLLDGERATRARLQTEIMDDVKALDAKVISLTSRLDARNRAVRRIAIGIWILFCSVALFFSIFPELISGNRARWIVFLILLTSLSGLGFFGDWVNRQIYKMVCVFSRSLLDQRLSAEEQRIKLQGFVNGLKGPA